MDSIRELESARGELGHSEPPVKGRERRQRVLLLSRDPALVESLEVPLELEGYELLIVCSEAGARSRVRLDDPDVVLLDLAATREELDLLEELRTPQGVSRVPVLVLSRDRDAARIGRAFESGAIACVTGALDPEQVVRKIKRCQRLGHLAQHQLRPAA